MTYPSKGKAVSFFICTLKVSSELNIICHDCHLFNPILMSIFYAYTAKKIGRTFPSSEDLHRCKRPNTRSISWDLSHEYTRNFSARAYLQNSPWYIFHPTKGYILNISWVLLSYSLVTKLSGKHLSPNQGIYLEYTVGSSYLFLGYYP